MESDCSAIIAGDVIGMKSASIATEELSKALQCVMVPQTQPRCIKVSLLHEINHHSNRNHVTSITRIQFLPHWMTATTAESYYGFSVIWDDFRIKE